MKYFGKEIRKHPLKISGSLLEVDLGANSGSTAIKTNNVTIGYPTANRWKDNLVGSYLNFYDHDTNVSEMLRFMAGVLSHSLDTAAPTPNTKFWNSVSTNYSGQSTTSKSMHFKIHLLAGALVINVDTCEYMYMYGSKYLVASNLI